MDKRGWRTTAAALAVLAAGEISFLRAGALTVGGDKAQGDVYGFVLTNFIYNRRRPNMIDIPLFAVSRSVAGAGASTFNGSIRQTRLGLNVSGDLSEHWKYAANIEGDFWGLRATSAGGNDIIQTAPRLRQAFFRAAAKGRTHSWTFTAGQDWVATLAPLNPVSLAHAAVPQMSMAGNLWNRIPQIRADYALEHGRATYAAKAAVLRPFSADLTGAAAGGVNQANQTDQPGSGELGASPMVQGLLEAGRNLGGRPYTLGVSGSIHRQTFEAPAAAPAGVTPGSSYLSTTVSAHAVLTLHRRLTLKGEAFASKGNRGLQGLSGVRAAGTDVEAVPSRGGWGEAGLKLSDKASLNGAWGAEDPDDTGVPAGTGAGNIVRNRIVSGNVIVAWTASLAGALEYNNVRTWFAGAQPGEADHYNAAFQMKF
jgi:hypothetical protein